MTDFRARAATAGLPSALGLLLLLSAHPAPTWAQALVEEGGSAVGEPLKLGPVEEEEDAAAGDEGPAGAGGDIAASEDGEAPSGIEVDRLEQLDPDTIGTLDPGKGGLGADLWEGSERRVIEALLPRLPAGLASPTLRHLAHRLLLSSAAPPARRSVESNGERGNLLALRVDRLRALGDIQGLNDLLRVVPQRYDDGTMAQARVEGLMLAHRLEAACRRVRNAIAEQHGAAFWQMALAVCQLRAGEPEAAALTAGLLREQGAGDHPAFFALIESRGAEDAALPRLDRVSPLHLALLWSMGRSVPAAVVERAGPAVLASVSRSPRAPLPVKTRAAERAAAVGAIDPQRTARLYATFEFDDGQLAEAPSLLRGSRAIRGSGRRALLYQAVRREHLTAPRAELVRLALQEARAADLYAVMAEVLAPTLAGMEPVPELAWFAETAGRALYAAGRPEAARAWHRLAREEAIVNPEAAVAVTSLWPYSRLAGAPALTPEGSLAAWRSARAGAEDGAHALQHRQSILRACFQALGEPEPVEWIDIALSGNGRARPAAPAPLVYAMEAAADAGRRGEALLLVLVVLGPGGPGDSHPMVLSEALSALTEVGLEAEARALAIEAVLANAI